MTGNSKADQGGELVRFTNHAPHDKEWTAHIKLLNEWQNSDRVLRDILQYARSGPFYPTDMHVDLINQVLVTRLEKLLGKKQLTNSGVTDCGGVAPGCNSSKCQGHEWAEYAVPTSVIQAAIAELRGN